jgi:hypothetical protein
MTDTFEQLIGMDGLPHDTCQGCGRLYSTDEVQKYGYNNPSICPDCMSNQEREDNKIADVLVNNLRKQGR